MKFTKTRKYNSNFTNITNSPRKNIMEGRLPNLYLKTKKNTNFEEKRAIKVQTLSLHCFTFQTF